MRNGNTKDDRDGKTVPVHINITVIRRLQYSRTCPHSDFSGGKAPSMCVHKAFLSECVLLKKESCAWVPLVLKTAMYCSLRFMQCKVPSSLHSSGVNGLCFLQHPILGHSVVLHDLLNVTVYAAIG